MNELRAIVDAYEGARTRFERVALATVVDVFGSAYRRPGARMLICEDGATVGTISGGCLERDVAEHAAVVMRTCEARVVEYDTRGEEDLVWGLGLGCNGVVRILVESLHDGGDGARALALAAECLAERRRAVVATVVRAGDGASIRPGTRIPLDVACDVSKIDSLGPRAREDAREALASGIARTRSYGGTEVFFDVFSPPRPLVVFGAGPDAAPVVRLARTLGWHVTVVDTRAREAARERFREADEVVLCRPEEATARVALSEETAVVVMTHDFLADVALLGALVPSPASYVGVLGPKQRTDRLLDAARADGATFEEWQLARVHGPAGIDLGAETPEEIALSILAEIKAARSGRGGGFLRDRAAPIHDDAAVGPRLAACAETPLPVCRSA